MSTDLRSALDTTSDVRYQASRRVTFVSIVWNLVLTVAQVLIGIIGNSQALVADGMHTLSDLATDFMVLYALKHGKKTADAEHPYGHARIETAVTMILGIVLLGVGVGIAVNAGIRLSEAQTFIIPSSITLWVAVITLFAKEGLYRYTMITANRYDSNMLRANAWHHRSDALSSLIVVAGIGGSLLGFGYLDAVAAIIVALMVAKVGVGLAWQALRELIDTGLSTEDLGAIRRTILAVHGVQALHLLRTRSVGGQALVDVHIIVDDRLSVSEGHQISETVRARLMREHTDIADVMVHIDIEEDIQGPACVDLPLRDEVLARLTRCFRDIPEARAIEHTLLHYRNGRIDIELLLPFDTVADTAAARRLVARFVGAVHADREFGKVDIRFH
ncbi:MAG: cation transporter [Gammaproteobacteria bacterium]|nr:cation transporter [Gammaproteobacteria bacterium]